MAGRAQASMKEERLFEAAQAQAIKEVVAWHLDEAMKKRKTSKNKWLRCLRPAGCRSTGS
jgi:hypothetical protein